MSTTMKWVILGVSAVVCVIQPELELLVVAASLMTLFSKGKK